MQLIIYSDGSARPNPGAGGWGIYGYLTSDNTPTGFKKHPFKALRYTDQGLVPDKDKDKANAVEVEEVIELVGHPTGKVSNNFCELQGFIQALELALTMVELEDRPLKKVLIITDSRYVTEGFTKHLKTWVKNGWKKRDGQTVANLSWWQHLHSTTEKLSLSGCQVKAKWVEGHSTSYGNEMADYFSMIGSSIATTEGTDDLTNEIRQDYLYRGALQKYKNSFAEKEVVLGFNEFFYSPRFGGNTVDYYFDQVEDKGVTTLTTDVLFTMHKGKTPLLVKRIKDFLNEFGVTSAYYSVKLSRLTSLDKLRLLEYFDFKYLVTPFGNGGWAFCRDASACITRYGASHHLVLTAEKIFLDLENDYFTGHKFDLTNTLFTDQKLQIKNNNAFFDVSKFIQDEIPASLTSYQLPMLNVGSEVPKYLVLNRLAKTFQCQLLMNHDEEQCVVSLGMVFIDAVSQEILIARNGVRKRLVR